jgi:colanic acid biosynthesis glycosyl transferase WcaI
MMRILLHDYGRHPYPWQLARTLAQRGHNVNYIFNAADPARTTLDVDERLKSRLTVTPITLAQPLHKASLFKRWRWEKEYGRVVLPEIDRFEPDVVISANTPLDPQAAILRHTRARNAKFIFWVQDLVSVATDSILRERIPGVGHAVGAYYKQLEKNLLRKSDYVILITEQFRPWMRKWGVDESVTTVIENWADIDQLPLAPRANRWAQEHGCTGKLCLLYAGTLGLKHNPELLIDLARHLKARPDVKIIVAAEGTGVPYLQRQKEAEALDNLDIYGFQPFNQLSQVMAAADVLIALLEPMGSQYCVPSKVLTYLCSERPILLAVPQDNLIAEIVERNCAGIVVPPNDPVAFVQGAQRLLDDPDLRRQCGRNGRDYAEANFNIAKIADRFEHILFNIADNTQAVAVVSDLLEEPSPGRNEITVREPLQSPIEVHHQ